MPVGGAINPSTAFRGPMPGGQPQPAPGPVSNSLPGRGGYTDPYTGRPRNPQPAPEIQLPNLPQPSNLQPTGMQYDSGTGDYQMQYAPPPPQAPKTRVQGLYTGVDNSYSSSSNGYELDPYGEEEQMIRLKAGLAQSSRDKALTQFQAAMSRFKGPGAASGDDDPELARYEAMQYGRAKDMIGQQKLGALKTFRDTMNSRGMYGSTDEETGIGDVISGANSELADVVLNQTGSNIQRRRQVSDRNFAAQEDYRRAMLNALSSAFSSSGSLY